MMIDAKASAHRSLRVFLMAAAAVLLAYGIALHTLLQDGLWSDEVWSWWAVQPDSIAGMLARIGGDYHPPLYFLLLQGWVKVTCQSPLCIRFPSLLAATLAAAATFALGRKLFNAQTGLIAAVALGVCGFFRYYAGETRMYSLLLLTSALCMMAFLSWLERPDLRRTLVYGVSIAAVVYSHYHGVWLFAAQAGYLLMLRRDRMVRWALPVGVGLALFAPWAPVLIGQIRHRPPGLIAVAAPTNPDTIRWIVWMMSGGLGAALLAPYLMAPDIAALRRHGRALALMGLWLVGVPAVMLAANAAGGNFFYHPRYLIGILPAGALMIAFGVQTARWRGLAFAAMGVALGLWIAQYRDFWPSRSIAYMPVLTEAGQGIKPGDAFIIDINPGNMVSYVDTNDRLHLRERATLDLTDRHLEPGQVRELMSGQTLPPTVWVGLPDNEAQTWALMAQITADHHAVYGGGVQNMVFYRFAPGGKPKLHFQFGDSLSLRAAIPDGETRIAAGQAFCLPIALKAAQGLDGSLSLAVHLVDPSGRSAAQWDGGLGVRDPGEAFSLSPCIEGAGSLPPGEYVAQVTVYNWQTGVRLPLGEVSTGAAVGWGDTLVPGMVIVSR